MTRPTSGQRVAKAGLMAATSEMWEIVCRLAELGPDEFLPALVDDARTLVARLDPAGAARIVERHAEANRLEREMEP